MKRLFLGFFILSALLLYAVPHNVFAAGTLTGPIFPEVCHCNSTVSADGTITSNSAPDWGCVLQTIQNVVNALVYFGIIFMVFMIAYTGFSLMLSGPNPEVRSMIRTRFLNIVVGIAVIFASWLIVDFVLKIVYNPTVAFDGKAFGPWNSILQGNGLDYCIKPTEAHTIYSGSITPNTTATVSNGSIAAGSSGNNVGAGTCSVANVGPCTVQTLSNTCFGANAQQASKICNHESGGNPVLLSGTDKLNSGSGPSYSVGMFQINLTAVDNLNGLNCKAAFTGTCNGKRTGSNATKVGPTNMGYCTVSVKSDAASQALYKKCVAAAQNPQVNLGYACSLYSKSGGYGAWYNECHI